MADTQQDRPPKRFVIWLSVDDGDWIKSAKNRKREQAIHDALAAEHAAEKPKD